jgi:hypothetical protein
VSAPAVAVRPASEMEWEELLVRYEIGPRALGFALDDGDPEGPARERVGDLLRALVVNEMRTATLFEAMRTGAAPSAGATRIEVMEDEPRAAFERFTRLRGRNFAAVQRRGLEVWAWHTQAHPHGEISAYQLIQASCKLDGETLAEIRQALRGAGAC